MTTVTTTNQDASDLNTLPDPRSPSPLSTGSSNGSVRHPDLSSEVAALSTKLINAINHQTHLDDELQTTRHDLDSARERIAQLEAAAKDHDEMVQSGVLVKKIEKEKVEQDLNQTINEERRRRGSAERGKRQMETELENLTSSLFEEANGMVAQARREREDAERRVDQLKAKLDESQILLTSHQEQLHDLKAVLQQVQSETPQLPDSAHASAGPATPTTGFDSKRNNNPEIIASRHSARHSTSSFLGQPPEPPLKFSHLLHPVMRTDIVAYDEFVSMLKLPKSMSPPSRNHSGNFSGLNLNGVPTATNQSTVFDSTHRHSSSGSSLPTSSSQTTPNLGPTIVNSPSDPNSGNLKEAKFYKRALVEDIEPTLRLDAAPGLSWLARRTVLNSMLGGYLVVEPFSQNSMYYSPAFACAMCGEARAADEHMRKYRFRTSDSSDAQRYPLCDYCLARVRASCDFIGFLRACKQGLWRGSGSGDVELEGRAAWEESVRLRERMLWARLGGGVLPTTSPIATEIQASPLKQSMERPGTVDRSISHSVQSSITGLRNSKIGQPPSPVRENSRSESPAQHRPSELSSQTVPDLRPSSSHQPTEHSPSRPGSAPYLQRSPSPLKTQSDLNPVEDVGLPKTETSETSEPATVAEHTISSTKAAEKPKLPPRNSNPPPLTSDLSAARRGSASSNISSKGNLVAALASKFQDSTSSFDEPRKQSVSDTSLRRGSAQSSARNSGRNTPAAAVSPERSPERSVRTPGASPERQSRSSIAIPGAFE